MRILQEQNIHISCDSPECILYYISDLVMSLINQNISYLSHHILHKCVVLNTACLFRNTLYFTLWAMVHENGRRLFTKFSSFAESSFLWEYSEKESSKWRSSWLRLEDTEFWFTRKLFHSFIHSSTCAERDDSFVILCTFFLSPLLFTLSLCPFPPTSLPSFFT